MKKFLGFCLIVVSLLACFDETRVDPARPSTFVRYINGGNPDSARALEKAPDGGYILLANTYPKDKAARIKVVKTDEYGTVLWSTIIPQTADGAISKYRANSISVIDDGYIITGETINSSDGKASLLIVEVNADGESAPEDMHTIALPSVIGGQVRGQAIEWISNESVMVLCSLTGTPSGNIVLTELNLSNSPPTVTWDQVYGSNPIDLVNRLYLDYTDLLNPPDSAELVIGGTVNTSSSTTEVHMVRTVQNGLARMDDPVGELNLNERVNGMCKTLNGYAIVGSSNGTGTKSDRDIFFRRLTPFGEIIENSNRKLPVFYPKSDQDVGLDDEANAMSITKDQGFIILGTITTALVPNTDLEIGRGETDYYLVKVNNFGEQEWTTTFGSKKVDIGVGVVQAEDGGYVILGTTHLANVATLALIKTNSAGEIK